jgi:hypothetical protein
LPPPNHCAWPKSPPTDNASGKAKCLCRREGMLSSKAFVRSARGRRTPGGRTPSGWGRCPGRGHRRFTRGEQTTVGSFAGTSRRMLAAAASELEAGHAASELWGAVPSSPPAVGGEEARQPQAPARRDPAPASSFNATRSRYRSGGGGSRWSSLQRIQFPPPR